MAESDGQVGAPGHHDFHGVRRQLLDLSQQFYAPHPGHLVVRNDYGNRLFFNYFEGFQGRAGGQYVEPPVLEDAACVGKVTFFVVNEEDRLLYSVTYRHLLSASGRSIPF